MRPSTETTSPRDREAPDGTPLGSALFRDRARRAAETPRHEGDLLRLSPSWARSVYWVLLGMSLLLIVGGLVGRSREFASGPAVLRVGNGLRLTALAAGTVERLDVIAGEHVVAGQSLVQFHSEDERNVLSHLQTEFDLHLVHLLREPGDKMARNTLAGLRAQRKLAEARLAERTLVAPTEGWVQDVRIRPGQRLAAGETVVSLVARQEQHTLMAFLPGEFRPLLKVGQPLNLIPVGYPHSRIRMSVESVQEEVVTAQAALAPLGVEWQNAIQLQGSVTVVTATLPATTFQADGQERPLYSGMQGKVEVCVREQAILLTLIPGLESLVERFRN